MSDPTPQTGKLKSNVPGGSVVNVRQQPSIQAALLSTKPVGTVVKVLGKTPQADENGKFWYQVNLADVGTGWVREDVLELLPPKPGNPVDANTRLYFETDTRLVRVYEEGVALYMNVYHKKTSKTELNRVPATKLAGNAPTISAPIVWEIYLANQAGRTYQAKFERRGRTELQLTDSSSGKNLESPESGFKASGTEYQRA